MGWREAQVLATEVSTSSHVHYLQMSSNTILATKQAMPTAVTATPGFNQFHVFPDL